MHDAVRKICSDAYGTTYYAMDYVPGQAIDLPWGNERFDCILFPPPYGDRAIMEQLVQVLPYRQIDWLHTASPAAQYWHDQVDHQSVLAGVQENIGDGKPMTAWFDDITTVREWRLEFNHGSTGIFLFVFTGHHEPLEDRMTVIRAEILRH